jgi:uncharacterized membrane protein HdeD (DUF308 family)
MRSRSLTKNDCARLMEQTLLMRGVALVALALCGLRWPALALGITLADIGVISIMYAVVDLVLARAVRRDSSRLARRSAAMGILGLGYGVGMLLMPVTQLPNLLILSLSWLAISGAVLMYWGFRLPVRERAHAVVSEWGAVQLLLAFVLLLVHPDTEMALRYSGAGYAAFLGVAEVVLGLWLRHRSSSLRRPEVATV